MIPNVMSPRRFVPTLLRLWTLGTCLTCTNGIFFWPSHSFFSASNTPGTARSLLDYFPKISFKEPLVMGYKHYKRVDFGGDPARAVKHDFVMRIGPEPVPFYKKDPHSPIIRSQVVSSNEIQDSGSHSNVIGDFG